MSHRPTRSDSKTLHGAPERGTLGPCLPNVSVEHDHPSPPPVRSPAVAHTPTCRRRIALGGASPFRLPSSRRSSLGVSQLCTGLARYFLPRQPGRRARSGCLYLWLAGGAPGGLALAPLLCGLSSSRTLARGAWPCRGPLLLAISEPWILAEFSGLSLAVAAESGLPPSPTPAPSPSLCFSARACGRKGYWNQAWVHVLLGGEFSHLQGIVGLFLAK